MRYELFVIVSVVFFFFFFCFFFLYIYSDVLSPFLFPRLFRLLSLRRRVVTWAKVWVLAAAAVAVSTDPGPILLLLPTDFNERITRESENKNDLVMHICNIISDKERWRYTLHCASVCDFQLRAGACVCVCVWEYALAVTIIGWKQTERMVIWH